MTNRNASRATAVVASLAALLIPTTVVSTGASAQVFPGESSGETPRERAAYQALIDKNGPDCPGLQDRLYGARYRCIARFGPGAKASRDYSGPFCSNVDLRMKACGIAVPKMPKGLAPAELREQERARHSEAHRP